MNLTPDQLAILRYLEGWGSVGCQTTMIATYADRRSHGASWARHRLESLVRLGLVDVVRGGRRQAIFYRLTEKATTYLSTLTEAP